MSANWEGGGDNFNSGLLFPCMLRKHCTWCMVFHVNEKRCEASLGNSGFFLACRLIVFNHGFVAPLSTTSNALSY